MSKLTGLFTNAHDNIVLPKVSGGNSELNIVEPQ
jgi:hypothetical protein